MQSITRRDLIGAGLAVGGAMLFSGCSWTPRNAGQSENTIPDSDVSSAVGTTQKAGEAVGGAASVEDGLLPVKGGSFTMGSPEDEPWRVGDEVQHDVTLDDFYLSPLEVSEADFRWLMDTGGGSAELPVTGITWHEAVAYCNALSVDMARYGTIYLSYPNWWASIPMPLATFLESYDFSGKTILPFCSNGGGGLGQSVAAISKLSPASHVGQGLSIYYSGGSDMPKQVKAWVASQGQQV